MIAPFAVCGKATRATPWSRSRRNAIGSTAEGSVRATGGGVYTVLLDDGRTVQASLRGKLKQRRRRVVIGDRVTVFGRSEAWTVESVAARTTELIRRDRGGRAPKVVAANLDRVFAVLALLEPRATTELADRLLVLIEASDIHPMLVLNKLDLPGAPGIAEAFIELYEEVGYRVFAVSALSREGLEAFGTELRQGSSALIGPSGVGKSSLLNALTPELRLPTCGLSGKTGTGRHTTVASCLIGLSEGGLVADTPGFGDVALWGVSATQVAGCFPEFEGYAASCRFRSCTHVHEPDCGVRSAVSRGLVHDSRYRSYLKLMREAEEAVR